MKTTGKLEKDGIFRFTSWGAAQTDIKSLRNSRRRDASGENRSVFWSHTQNNKQIRSYIDRCNNGYKQINSLIGLVNVGYKQINSLIGLVNAGYKQSNSGIEPVSVGYKQ